MFRSKGKNWSSLVLVLCISLLLLTACGKENTNNPETVSENITDEGVNEKQAELTFPITLRVGYSTNDTDPRGVVLEEFKKTVEAQTDKNILIEIYPSGKLGSDSELIAGMINKSVDMTVSSAGNYAAYATKIGVSALPFLFSDFDTAWEFVDSDIVCEINKDLEAYNMHVLACFDNGFRCVTTSEAVGPVDEVSDMKGLNIRTPDNQIVMETMSQLGANPSSYPFAQLKDALASGQFDAQENPIPVIYNNALYDVQKYLSVTNHSYDAMPLTIRQDIWVSLTPEYQKIILDAALTAQKDNRALVKKQTEDYVALLEEKGMAIVYPDLSEFKNSTRTVMEVFVNVYGEDLLSQVRKYTE